MLNKIFNCISVILALILMHVGLASVWFEFPLVDKVMVSLLIMLGGSIVCTVLGLLINE